MSRRRLLRSASIGLASVLLAAAATGVAASAASASSTAVCATPSCEPTGIYSANTPLTASLAKGTELKLLSSFGTVACKSSSIAGETTAEAGKPLPLKITEVTFGSCVLSGKTCTSTTGALPTSPSLKATGEGDGTLSLEGLVVTFKCGFLINCAYEDLLGSAENPVQLKGGNPASFDAVELPEQRSSGFCPETSKLDVSYTLTEPTSAYAVESEGQTLLCATPSCEPTGIYPANTPLTASLAKGTEFKLLSSIGTVACKSSSIAGETTAEAGKPLPLKINEVTFGSCMLGEKACTVTTKTLPTAASLKASGEGDGTLSLKGAQVKFQCGFLINCIYFLTSALQFEGGNPASFGAKELALNESEGFCPEVTKLDATYTLTEPAPAFAVESEGQTLLCATPTCEPSIYPAETAVAASLQKGVPLQLLTNLGTIKCESSTLAGKTTAEEGEPLPLKVTELSLGSCKVGETGCTATTPALPTSSSLKATGEGDGTFSLEGGEWTLKCGALIDCTFATPTLQFEGGSPAGLSAEEVVPKSVKGSLCPGASAFDATYTLTEPTPAFAVET